VLCLFVVISLAGNGLLLNAQESESSTDTDASSSRVEPVKLSIVPFAGKNAPEFAPLVAEKVVGRRFGGTDLIETDTVSRSEVTLPGGGDIAEVSEEQLVEFLSETGRKRGADFAVGGLLEKEESLYHLSLLMVEAKTSTVFLRDSKTAVGIGDLDRIAQGFSERFVELQFGEEAARRIAGRRAGETAAAAAGAGAGIAELEKLAEEDPDRAIEQLPEKVQEEFKKRAKDEAKKEVEEEEVKKLFEEEKEREQEKRRKRNLRIAGISAYGLKLAGGVSSDLGVQARMRSLRGWSLYMNQYDWEDYYDQYRHFQDSAQGLSIGGTSAQLLSNGVMSYLYFRYPADQWTLSRAGTRLLAISSVVYTSGEAVGLASGLIGYKSMEIYSRYMSKDEPKKISDEYDEYRIWHNWYEGTRYATYGLKLLGVTGALSAFIFFDGDEALAADGGARRSLGLSNIFSGLAAVSTHMALNSYSRGIEASISARSPSGNSKADPLMRYAGYSVTFGTAALGLYTAAAITEYRGITHSGSGGRTAAADRRESGSRGDFFGDTDLAMSFLPSVDGFSVNFSLRSYGR